MPVMIRPGRTIAQVDEANYAAATRDMLRRERDEQRRYARLKRDRMHRRLQRVMPAPNVSDAARIDRTRLMARR
jgi:GrpB-like predicted nucleotidyltransferase (UPF0157 family)